MVMVVLDASVCLLLILTTQDFLFLKKKKLFVCLFVYGCAGSLLLRTGFSLVAENWDYSLVAMLGLLVAMTSLEHRL